MAKEHVQGGPSPKSGRQHRAQQRYVASPALRQRRTKLRSRLSAPGMLVVVAVCMTHVCGMCGAAGRAETSSHFSAPAPSPVSTSPKQIEASEQSQRRCLSAWFGVAPRARRPLHGAHARLVTPSRTCTRRAPPLGLSHTARRCPRRCRVQPAVRRGYRPAASPRASTPPRRRSRRRLQPSRPDGRRIRRWRTAQQAVGPPASAAAAALSADR